MGNRSPRHLRPGQHDLRGKRAKSVCPCCDPVIDHRGKTLAAIAEAEMRDPEPDEGPLET